MVYHFNCRLIDGFWGGPNELSHTRRGKSMGSRSNFKSLITLAYQDRFNHLRVLRKCGYTLERSHIYLCFINPVSARLDMLTFPIAARDHDLHECMENWILEKVILEPIWAPLDTYFSKISPPAGLPTRENVFLGGGGCAKISEHFWAFFELFPIFIIFFDKNDNFWNWT